MLATIVLLFGLCWLPLHLFITITTTFKENIFGDLAYHIYFGVHWLSMANSFVNPVIYGFMNENFRTDLRSLALTYICCCCGHRRLRYRPAAVRWRLGYSNVYDSKQSTTQRYISESIKQREMEMESMTPPSKKRLYRNGQRTETCSLNDSKKYSCHNNSDNNSSPTLNHGRNTGNGTGRSIFITGRRKQYDICRKEKKSNESMEENGATLMKIKHELNSRECNGCQDCSLHPVVLFAESGVVDLTDQNRKGQG